MHSPRRFRALALLALVTALLMSGCVRVTTDLQLDGRRDSISGTILVASQVSEDTEEARAAAAALALDIEQRALPGLRESQDVTAAAYESDGWIGSELTLNHLPLSELRLARPSQEPLQLITRTQDSFTVFGVLDLAGVSGVPAAEVEGERPPGAADSEITIAVTFPGEVEAVEGSAEAATIEGSQVRWTTQWDQPITLNATGSATASSYSQSIWTVIGLVVGAVIVLAIAGVITVYVRARHD